MTTQASITDQETRQRLLDAAARLFAEHGFNKVSVRDICKEAGANVAALYVAVFVVYWCYGTQLSVNGAAASDFWGTKNAGVNYGILFTAWGVAGIIGPRIGGVLYDRYHNYQAAFYTAAVLAGVALLCELGARRPVN